MYKFDIKDPTLPIFQSTVVQASAGCGKTFAIEHLFVRLLLESNPPISCEEILAVTFTRDATQEMRERIYKKLQEMAQTHPKQIAQALQNFSDSQIFTIHGFCHRMLTEFAFEAGLSFQGKNSVLEDATSSMRSIVYDFFYLAKEKEVSSDIISLLKRSRYHIEDLVDIIVLEMQRGKEPQEIVLPSFPILSFDSLWQMLIELAPKYKRLNLFQCKEQVEKFYTYLHTKNQATLLEENPWFFEKLKEDSGLFYRIKAELEIPLQLLRDSKEMLRRVAAHCRHLWKSNTQKYDVLCTKELLHTMQKALQMPKFVQRIQNKYKAVIIDEFQDTDPLQWEIFSTLFRPNHLLYLVGDPKQSIYGFRSADLYTYLQACASLGEESTAYLDTNFRSSPPLVAALNELFLKNPHWLSLSSLESPITYQPIKAGRESSILDEEPIVYFGMQEKVGRARSWPTKAMEESHLFPYITQEILRLTNIFSLSAFAILVKDRYQAQRVQQYLKKWKIPSSIKRVFSIAETKGFIAMEMFLQALAYPKEKKYTNTFIKGPLMGEGDNPFPLLHQLYQESGFAKVITEFMQHYFRPNKDPSLLHDFLHTAELLMEENHGSIAQLLHQMQTWKVLDASLEGSYLQQKTEGSEEKVAILTTFASKGLEFEVVFALSLASQNFTEEKTQEQKAEQMRELYVALTRAREKLYIPFLQALEKGAKSFHSAVDLFFQNAPPSMQWIDPSSLQLHPFRESIKKQKLLPPLVPKTQFATPYIQSFSSMVAQLEETPMDISPSTTSSLVTEKNAYTLPKGANTGIVLHAAWQLYFQNPSLPLDTIISRSVTHTHLKGWEEVIYTMMHNALHYPLVDGTCLAHIEPKQYYPEFSFFFLQEGNWVKGFVDLVFCINNRFYLLDWKTHWLGFQEEDYLEENLWRIVHESQYLLQAQLYQIAIEKYLRQFFPVVEMGESFYFFLRPTKVLTIKQENYSSCFPNK